jgi:hypothetical protein
LSILAECNKRTESAFPELECFELRGEAHFEQARTVAKKQVLNAASRELLAHTSATKRSTDFIALSRIPRLNNASSWLSLKYQEHTLRQQIQNHPIGCEIVAQSVLSFQPGWDHKI